MGDVISRCSELFARAVFNAALKPELARDFIVRNKVIVNIGDYTNVRWGWVKALLRAMDLLGYVVFTSGTSVKGVPVKYRYIEIKLRSPESFARFLSLGALPIDPSVNFLVDGQSPRRWGVDAEEQCRRLILARIRDVAKLAIAYLPPLWFMVRHYEVNNGTLRLSLVVPLEDVNYVAVGEGEDEVGVV